MVRRLFFHLILLELRRRSLTTFSSKLDISSFDRQTPLISIRSMWTEIQFTKKKKSRSLSLEGTFFFSPQKLIRGE